MNEIENFITKNEKFLFNENGETEQLKKFARILEEYDLEKERDSYEVASENLANLKLADPGEIGGDLASSQMKTLGVLFLISLILGAHRIFTGEWLFAYANWFCYAVIAISYIVFYTKKRTNSKKVKIFNSNNTLSMLFDVQVKAPKEKLAQICHAETLVPFSVNLDVSRQKICNCCGHVIYDLDCPHLNERNEAYEVEKAEAILKLYNETLEALEKRASDIETLKGGEDEREV